MRNKSIKNKKESVIKAIELSDDFFDYIIDIIPNMNKQKEIYKNNIYIQKLVDTLIKEVTDFHIRIILADNFTDDEKKIKLLKGSDALLSVIENDIQRLINKGFISIKRGMYEKNENDKKKKKKNINSKYLIQSIEHYMDPILYTF